MHCEEISQHAGFVLAQEEGKERVVDDGLERLIAEAARHEPVMFQGVVLFFLQHSKIEQNAQAIFDLAYRRIGHLAESARETFEGHRPHVFRLDEALHGEAGLRRIHRDVERNSLGAGCHRQHHGQASWTMIERVDRDHQRGADTGLLVPASGVQVDHPDFAAQRELRGHSSSNPSDNVASQSARSASSSSHASGWARNAA